MSTNMEIPTLQEDIILKEYGRNVQNLVKYIKTIENKEQRSKYAAVCIELMKMINPTMKDTFEHVNKMWDQLYIISNFDLEVDSPNPMPDRAIIGKKPNTVEYNMNRLNYRHYGRNVELIIKKAVDNPDIEEKEASIIMVGKIMKRFYQAWNKDNVEDEVILEHIKELSNGKLDYDIEKVKTYKLFDSAPSKETKLGPINQANRRNGGSNNYKKTNNRGNRPRR